MGYILKVNKKVGTTTVNFTPSFYKNAYTKFRNGVYREVIEMMNRSEIDSHVAGCLLGRKAGYQRDFNVLPYDDNDQDKERAQRIYNLIKSLKYRDLFKAIQEAVLKKFTVIDFDWEVKDGWQVPIGFKKYDHKYFRYDEGVLKVDFGRILEDIPPETLVCETDDIPALFPVLRDYILKDFGLESWAAFIETFGEGIILGKYPFGATDEFVSAVDSAVNDIARSSRGTMPDSADIEIKETQRTTGDHSLFADTASRGISIALLGHANAVEQSKGLQVGENLSSFKVKSEIAKDDMYFIDAHIQKLIEIVIDRNIGDGRYPIFSMDKSEPIDRKEWMEIVDTAYSHGLKIHPDEYRKVGLYVFDDQEYLQKNPDSIF